MATSYGYTTNGTIVNDVLEEINEEDRLSGLSPETLIKWILHACQLISQRVMVRESVVLRLIEDQEEYEFADTDAPVTGSGTVSVTSGDDDLTGTLATGTGTVSTDGDTVTGVGTAFTTELAVGVAFKADSQTLTVMEIHSDTECVLSGGFTTDLSGETFEYSNTKFGRELSIGSTVVIDTTSSVTAVIKTITNAYQAVLTTFASASKSAKTFTVDRKVSEIPTKFHRILDTSREDNNYTKTPKIVSVQLLRTMQRDTGVNDGWSNLQRPQYLAPWVNKNGRRVLIIWPTAEADKDITLYGLVRIRPEYYTATASTSTNCPLDSRYEPAVRQYVKYRAYQWLKEHKLGLEEYRNFEAMLLELSRIETVPLNIQIDTV